MQQKAGTVVCYFENNWSPCRIQRNHSASVLFTALQEKCYLCIAKQADTFSHDISPFTKIKYFHKLCQQSNESPNIIIDCDY